ncbi:MAG TPA: replication initiation factor domain-containing protein, partial [Ktedonobacteraceae bacterium]|nr:replication initiation factor domain-containing protein [Ktedonobacteraceae bacterium]
MSISATIDWLSATFKISKDTALHLYGITTEFDEIKAMHGYNSACRYKGTGVMKFWNNTGDRMGVHYQYPGSSLASLGSSGIPPTAILNRVLTLGGKVSRIDLAIDIIDEKIDIASLAKDVSEENYPGRKLLWHEHKSPNGGHTLDIGSPKSDKWIRIYNKAAEVGLDMFWTRLEIQMTGDVAKTISKAFNSGVMGNLHSAAWAIASGSIDLTANPNFAAFGEATDDIGIPKIE